MSNTTYNTAARVRSLTSMDDHEGGGVCGSEVATNPIPGLVDFSIDCKRNGPLRCGGRRLVVQVAIGRCDGDVLSLEGIWRMSPSLRLA